MANLIDQIAIATNETFINRVQQAAVKSAIAIASEAASGDDELDAGRLSLARQVVIEPHRFGRLMALGVVTNAIITLESTDNDIEFTVASIWNCYAGVRTPQPQVAPRMQAAATPKTTRKRTTTKAQRAAKQ